MTKVKIETLTSTHVDSGNVLFHDNDFVRGADLENNPILGIVDMRKAMNLIGERNIGAWVAMIDRGVPISDVIKRYAPRANVLDYSCRTIHAGFEGNKRLDLREFIHDGLGRPYLPGSSIKGAIRTAILSALANNMPSIGTWQTLEKNLFGKEPQSDIFRFIHVGDALFSELEDMYAFLIVLLNERKSQDVLDCSKKQLVEVLGPKSKSSMDVEIDEKGFSLFRNNPDNSSFLKSMSSDVRQVLSGDIRHMFSLINSHTSRLVDEEIEIWEEKERYSSFGFRFMQSWRRL